MDKTTVRQGRGELKTFLNFKCFFAFILFYYLHNYFKCTVCPLYYLQYTEVFVMIFSGGPDPPSSPQFTPLAGPKLWNKLPLSMRRA